MLIAQVVFEMNTGLIVKLIRDFNFEDAPFDVIEYFMDHEGFSTNFKYWLILKDTDDSESFGQYRMLCGEPASVLFSLCKETREVRERDGFKWVEAFDFPGVIFIVNEEKCFAFLEGYEVS